MNFLARFTKKPQSITAQETSPLSHLTEISKVVNMDGQAYGVERCSYIEILTNQPQAIPKIIDALREALSPAPTLLLQGNVNTNKLQVVVAEEHAEAVQAAIASIINTNHQHGMGLIGPELQQDLRHLRAAKLVEWGERGPAIQLTLDAGTREEVRARLPTLLTAMFSKNGITGVTQEKNDLVMFTQRGPATNEAVTHESLQQLVQNLNTAIQGNQTKGWAITGPNEA